MTSLDELRKAEEEADKELNLSIAGYRGAKGYMEAVPWLGDIEARKRTYREAVAARVRAEGWLFFDHWAPVPLWTLPAEMQEEAQMATNTTITCDYCQEDLTERHDVLHVTQAVTAVWRGWEPSPLQRGLDFCSRDHLVSYFREMGEPVVMTFENGG